MFRQWNLKLDTEQGVLRTSIIVTFVLAGADIVFGLLSGSYAIIFDGVYSLTDAIMTIMALLVSKLIASSAADGPERSALVKHFTMGFWHLEPMVLGLNGVMLTGAAIYAFINAIASIMSGGRILAFDKAAIYPALTVVVASGMVVFDKKANRNIQSEFIALDAKAWSMSAALSAALLVAFVFGFAIQGTGLEWISPYVDPAALAVVCLIILRSLSEPSNRPLPMSCWLRRPTLRSMWMRSRGRSSRATVFCLIALTSQRLGEASKSS